MNLLAFELATEACSVAVWTDGEVRERFEVAPRRHAELALPWAEQLLAEAGLVRAQLDVVAVGRGPGAFTGVRLAIALAQGIGMALERPVVPVSTLAVLAAGEAGRGDVGTGAEAGVRVLAAIDARMNEVYSGAFEVFGDHVIAVGDESVATPDAVAAPEGAGWRGRGTGFAACDGVLRQRLDGRLAGIDAAALPHAGDLARLAAHAAARGGAIAPDQVEPAYLRNQVALTLAEQQALRDRR